MQQGAGTDYFEGFLKSIHQLKPSPKLGGHLLLEQLFIGLYKSASLHSVSLPRGIEELGF
jgi:hypothetical protein